MDIFTYLTTIYTTYPSMGWGLAAVMGLLLTNKFKGIWRTESRNVTVDQANDQLLHNMQTELARLTARLDAADQERERYFKETIHLTSLVAALTENVRVLEAQSKTLGAENMRLQEMIKIRESEIAILKAALQSRNDGPARV